MSFNGFAMLVVALAMISVNYLLPPRYDENSQLNTGHDSPDLFGLNRHEDLLQHESPGGAAFRQPQETSSVIPSTSARLTDATYVRRADIYSAISMRGMGFTAVLTILSAGFLFPAASVAFSVGLSAYLWAQINKLKQTMDLLACKQNALNASHQNGNKAGTAYDRALVQALKSYKTCNLNVSGGHTLKLQKIDAAAVEDDSDVDSLAGEYLTAVLATISTELGYQADVSRRLSQQIMAIQQQQHLLQNIQLFAQPPTQQYLPQYSQPPLEPFQLHPQQFAQPPTGGSSFPGRPWNQSLNSVAGNTNGRSAPLRSHGLVSPTPGSLADTLRKASQA